MPSAGISVNERAGRGYAMNARARQPNDTLLPPLFGVDKVAIQGPPSHRGMSPWRSCVRGNSHCHLALAWSCLASRLSDNPCGLASARGVSAGILSLGLSLALTDQQPWRCSTNGPKLVSNNNQLTPVQHAKPCLSPSSPPHVTLRESWPRFKS